MQVCPLETVIFGTCDLLGMFFANSKLSLFPKGERSQIYSRTQSSVVHLPVQLYWLEEFYMIL